MPPIENLEAPKAAIISHEHVSQALMNDIIADRWRPYPPYPPYHPNPGPTHYGGGSNGGDGGSWPPSGGNTWPPGVSIGGGSSDGPIVCPAGEVKQNSQCVPG